MGVFSHTQILKVLDILIVMGIMSACNSYLKVNTAPSRSQTVTMPLPTTDGTDNSSGTNSKESAIETTTTWETIYTNSPVSLVAPVVGASSYEWQQVGGNGEVKFSDAHGFKTEVRANDNGKFLIKLLVTVNSANLTEAGSNQALQSSNLYMVWDTTPPEFSSLLPANEAADGEIVLGEVLSSKAAFTLNATDYAAVTFTGLLDAANPVTCDGTKSYQATTPPVIASLPAVNGPYVGCARLSDEAGNVTYGKSSVINRNVVAAVPTPINFAALLNSNQIQLTWESGGGNSAGFLVVRSSAPVTFMPVNGVSYAVGISDGTYEVIHATNGTAHNDAYLDDLVNYYAVYAFDTELSYSLAALASSVTGTMLPVSSITLVNEAADGVVDYSDLPANNAAIYVNAPGFSAVSYTSFLSSVGPVDCKNGQSYSAQAPAISSIPTTNGNFVICVKVEDTGGHIVYGKSPAIYRHVTPQAPLSFTATHQQGYNDLSWTSGGGEESGYMVVRSKNPITFTPTNGQTYAVGNISADVELVYSGALMNYQDVNFKHSVYHYAVYALNSVKEYSPAATTSCNTTNLIAPSNFTATVQGTAIDLAWTSGGADSVGFMLVRSLSPVTFIPQMGVVYNHGRLPNSEDIAIYVGPNSTFKDVTALQNCRYYFALFAIDAFFGYSSAPIANAKVTGTADCVVGPVDLAMMNNQNVAFKVQNSSASPMSYRFDLSSSFDFSSVTTYNADNVAANTIETSPVPAASLTNRNIYWWRMRSSSDGGNTWSANSTPRSFRIDNRLNDVRWHLDSLDQLINSPGVYRTDLDALASNSGELQISATKTTGSFRTSPLNVNELGYSKWGIALSTWYLPDPSANSVNMKVEFYDPNTTTWDLIPLVDFPNNSGSMLHFNLDSVDPVKYPIIRLLITLNRNSTGISSPSFLDISVAPRRQPAQNDFINGGFESTNNGEWQIAFSGTPTDVTTDLAKSDGSAHEGSKYAYMTHNVGSNFSYSRENYIYQSVYIPMTATTLTVYRKYWRDAWGAVIRGFINDVQVDQLDNTKPYSAGWTQLSFPVTAYRGQTITFSMGIYDYYWAGAGDHGAWFGLDKLQVQ